MKFLLINMLFSVCILGTLNAQMLLNEGFEGGALPAGWDRTQNPASRGWEFGNPNWYNSSGFYIFKYAPFTKAAVSNDFLYDNAAGTNNKADRDRLITPVLDFSSYSNVHLAFYATFKNTRGSSGYIEYSYDNGTTWTILDSLSPSLPVAASNPPTSFSEYLIDLSPLAGNNSVRISFTHNDHGLQADGFGLDSVRVYIPAQNDVKQISNSLNGYIVRGTSNIDVDVVNKGIQTIQSLDFSYSLDSGATWITTPLSGLNILAGDTAQINLVAGLQLWDCKHYPNVIAKLENPNGQIDPSPDDNTLRSDFYLITAIGQRNILMEEYTGAWCVYCPDASWNMIALLDTCDDVIAASIHQGDAMQFSEGLTIFNTYVSGPPAATFDRLKYDNVSTRIELGAPKWPLAVYTRRLQPPMATLEASTAYDPSTRQLTIDFGARFVSSVSGDFRFSVMLVEDSVIGSGTGYNQANDYNNTPGHPYYQAGNPIVGFIHRHVLRQILGGSWGSAGLIDNTVQLDSTYSHQYSLTLNPNWKEKDMKVVILVQRYTASTQTREIINALELELNGIKSQEINPYVETSILSFTNATCNTGTDGSVELTSLGTPPFSYLWNTGDTTAALANLQSGDYTVTVTDAIGGQDTLTINIAHPLQTTLAAEWDTIAGTGDITITVSAGTLPYTYNWSTGDSSASLLGVSAGSYTLTITDDAGCTKVLSHVFTEIEEPIDTSDTTGINNVVPTMPLQIYPNPTTGLVRLQSSINILGSAKIWVMNAMGQVTMQKEVEQRMLDVEIDLSTHAAGVYFIKVISGHQVGVQRLMLE